MSKFFTCPLCLLLAGACAGLASESMDLSGAVSGLGSSAEGPRLNSGLPKALEVSRFAPLLKKSPFTWASTIEANADFAKDLILAGYVRMDGQDYVLVANRNRPDRLMIGATPSPAGQGMILLQVERDPSGDPKKLKAKIRKGSEVATLSYETVSGPHGETGSGQTPPTPQPQPQPAQAVMGASGQQPAPAAPVIRRRVVPIPSAPPR